VRRNMKTAQLRTLIRRLAGGEGTEVLCHHRLHRFARLTRALRP
jgi:hypothetical protein